MNTLTLPARKSSKKSTAEFLRCLNRFAPVVGMLTIKTDRSEPVCYAVEERADEDQADVRKFFLSKCGDAGTDAEAALYCVRVRPEMIGEIETSGSCNCKGFHYSHTCKHVDAIQSLIVAGKL